MTLTPQTPADYRAEQERVLKLLNDVEAATRLHWKSMEKRQTLDGVRYYQTPESKAAASARDTAMSTLRDASSHLARAYADLLERHAALLERHAALLERLEAISTEAWGRELPTARLAELIAGDEAQA